LNHACIRPHREAGATLVNPTPSDPRGSALIVNFLDLQWFGCIQQSNFLKRKSPARDQTSQLPAILTSLRAYDIGDRAYNITATCQIHCRKQIK
jgi:hypothetical protein